MFPSPKATAPAVAIVEGSQEVTACDGRLARQAEKIAQHKSNLQLILESAERKERFEGYLGGAASRPARSEPSEPANDRMTLHELFVREMRPQMRIPGVNRFEKRDFSEQDIIQDAFVELYLKLTSKAANDEIIESVPALYYGDGKRTAKTNTVREKARGGRIAQAMADDAYLGPTIVRRGPGGAFRQEPCPGLAWSEGAQDAEQLAGGASDLLDVPRAVLAQLAEDAATDEESTIVDRLVEMVKSSEHVLLSAKEEAAFRAYCAGRSGKEAADALGMSYGAYRQALMRGREKVQGMLKSCERDRIRPLNTP